MPQPPLKRAMLALALCCTLLACRQSPQYEFDLIIAGGKLVDGSGSLWFPGDLAIHGEEIVYVGELKDREQKGRQVIDARGLWVAPGFIDSLSRSEPDHLFQPNSLSKVRQGVTTEILGGGQPSRFFQAAARPEPGSREVSADRPPWGQAFRRLRQGGFAVNVAAYVQVGDVVRSVLGQDRREPTQPEIAAMKQMVGQAMLAGALGLANSPRLSPAGILSGEQLAELAQEVKPHGGVYSAGIDSRAGIGNSLKGAIELAEQAQIPLDIPGLRLTGHRGREPLQEGFDAIEKGRESGLALTASLSPYRSARANLEDFLPPWATEGGREKLLERLSRSDLRARILRELRRKRRGQSNAFLAAGGWEGVVLLTANSRKFPALTGKSIQAIATELGQNPGDALVDILRETEGPVGVLYSLMSEEDLRNALQAPWVSIGSGGATAGIDPSGGEVPRPHGYGAFARVLGKYVREEGVLDLEEAVHKMTGMNAAKLGLRNRGLLQVGMKADITIFDAERVAGPATFQEPHRFAEGIEYVIVNGTLVIEGGRSLDARPGRFLDGPGKVEL
ncbi:MAG: amidohydrolase family protein [Acidobacteriota bacterium]|nr:amidohydrolase family protein [Acidobacteriota bacterium]